MARVSYEWCLEDGLIWYDTTDIEPNIVSAKVTPTGFESWEPSIEPIFAFNRFVLVHVFAAPT